MILPLLIDVVGQPVVDQPDPGIDLSVGLGGSAIGAFVTTLVVGAILVAMAPAYTDRMTDDVFDAPVGSFFYGLLCLLGLFLAIVLLVVTVIGIIFVIPLLLLAYLVWAVGSTLVFLSIGERILDDADWPAPLLVGAALNAGLALTGIGGVVSFCLGALGFGAVLLDWQA